MEFMFSVEGLLALATLTVLEIVLGIDNIVFISVVAARLPEAQQALARQLGLAAALVTRLLLLLSLSWLASLTQPLFEAMGRTVSARDLILLLGGLFLIWKATMEIHHTMEPESGDGKVRKASSFAAVITQIAVIDIIFSLDSVITAIGMVNHVPVMVAAILISVAIMLWAVGPISRFIHQHPGTKILAFALLVLVGVALVADAMHLHIPRGYIYFAVAFSLLVEMLNIAHDKKMRR